MEPKALYWEFNYFKIWVEVSAVWENLELVSAHGVRGSHTPKEYCEWMIRGSIP